MLLHLMTIKLEGVSLLHWTVHWDGRVYCRWRGDMPIASLDYVLGWQTTGDGEKILSAIPQNCLSEKQHRSSDAPGNFVFEVCRLLSF